MQPPRSEASGSRWAARQQNTTDETVKKRDEIQAKGDADAVWVMKMLPKRGEEDVVGAEETPSSRGKTAQTGNQEDRQTTSKQTR